MQVAGSQVGRWWHGLIQFDRLGITPSPPSPVPHILIQAQVEGTQMIHHRTIRSTRDREINPPSSFPPPTTSATSTYSNTLLMTDNTAGPPLARIQLASILSYPPLVFDCRSSHPRSFMKVLITVSILIPPFFFFPYCSQSASMWGGINHAHPALAHGGSLIPPTLQILLSLSLSFGTFQGPGILKQVTSIWISRVCSVPGSYHFIIPLVVHFSTPTLLFLPLALPYLAVLLVVPSTVACSQIFPIATLGSSIILYQHL